MREDFIKYLLFRIEALETENKRLKDKIIDLELKTN